MLASFCPAILVHNCIERTFIYFVIRVATRVGKYFLQPPSPSLTVENYSSIEKLDIG